MKDIALSNSHVTGKTPGHYIVVSGEKFYYVCLCRSTHLLATVLFVVFVLCMCFRVFQVYSTFQ